MGFLALIPGVTKLLSAIFDARVRMTAAQIGGDVEKARQIVAASQAEGAQAVERLRIIGQSRMLTLLVLAFAIPLAVFWCKVLLWDKVLGLGVTDPLTGQVGEWANQLIWFIFGAPAAMSIARMVMGGK